MNDCFFLPKETPLGKLTIDKVYHFYNFPRLFTCVNNLGTRYLSLSTFDDDEDYEWLYLRVSEKRHSELLAGEITIFQAFMSPEDGFLYKVTFILQNFIAAKLNADNISAEDLPDENLKLEEVISDGKLKKID